MNQSKKVAVFKSLADTTRLSIVQRLAQDSCAVSSTDIVQTCSRDLKLSQPTMSHHFSRLVQAGVLLEQKVGTGKTYQLNKPLLDAIGLDVKQL